MGDDPQAGLLARGITANLMTDLSKVFGLSLIGVVTLGGECASSTDQPREINIHARLIWINANQLSGTASVADRYGLV